MLVNTRKTFISSDGQEFGEPGEDHVDIARRVLPQHGIEAADMGDLYVQMFRLGYARALEDANEFEIERKEGLSEAQLRRAHEASISGKKVRVNSREFMASKDVPASGQATGEQPHR